MSDVDTVESTTWWGRFALQPEEVGLWSIGPLELWVSRTALDWRYGILREDDDLRDACRVQVPVPSVDRAALPPEAGRFGCSQTEDAIEVTPALADRSVVARPTVPFFVPPGQTIDLYVSTPLWVRLRAAKTVLCDLSTTRPSDTWFGTPTRGVLSYASRTSLRRTPEKLVSRAHRAKTWVSIQNASEQMLPLERLSLPVPQLSLYAGTDGDLWTERVSVTFEEAGALAQVHLGKGAPRNVGGGRQLAPPRASRGRSFASLVFSGLFEAGT